MVADEVRKLAERTMTATKEVHAAIVGIQDNTGKNAANVDATVEQIVAVVDRAKLAGESLQEVVSDIVTAAGEVQSIADVSAEQTESTDQIGSHMETIRNISSDTATAMQHSAMAVSDLISQIRNLESLADRLKTTA